MLVGLQKGLKLLDRRKHVAVSLLGVQGFGFLDGRIALVMKPLEFGVSLVIFGLYAFEVDLAFAISLASCSSRALLVAMSASPAATAFLNSVHSKSKLDQGRKCLFLVIFE